MTTTMGSTTTAAPSMPLWLRLYVARKLAGVEQPEMARYLGLSTKTISRWETGKNAPSRGNLIAWAGYTGQPSDWLIGDESELNASEDEGVTINGRSSHRFDRLKPSSRRVIRTAHRTPFLCVSG